MYEGYVSRIIPERQYRQLSQEYDAEQMELETRIEELSNEVIEEKPKQLRTDKFIALIKKYKNPTEVTDLMLNSLIDKVVVHEVVGKKGKNQTQQIDIYFNYIGQFEIALSDEEIREEEEKATKIKKAREEEKKKKRKAYGRKFREKRRAERMAANEGHLYPKQICECCGKEYWPTSNRQKYCSEQCAYNIFLKRVRKKRYEKKGNHTFNQKICIVCGKPFWPSNSRELMCSEKCKTQRAKERSVKYYEKNLEKEKNKWKERKEKRLQENEGHLYPKRICEYCGKEYWPAKNHQKYCSKKCGDKMFNLKNKGRDSAEKEGHKFYKKTCAVCGKEFWPTGASQVTCLGECQKERISLRHKENYRREVTRT